MGVIKTLQDSYRIAIKDLLEFERNRIGLIFLFLMPFFMLVMTGFIFPTGSGYTDVPVAIVDMDHSDASIQFIAQMEALNNKSNMMVFTYADTADDARTLITRGQVYGAIILSKGFGAEQATGKQSNITVLSDNSQPQLSMIMQGLGSQVVSMLGSIQGAMKVQMLGTKANMTMDNAAASAVIAPLKANVQGTVPGNMNYFSFVAPGLLMMIVMMGAMTGIPRAIAHDPSTQQSMNKLGRERGWGPYTRASFDAARSFDGALYVGDPETVAKKIIYLSKEVGITRFLLHVPVGTMPHDDVMRAIELLGTEVAPRVREEISRWEAENES